MQPPAASGTLDRPSQDEAPSQYDAPYFEALVAHEARGPHRMHVPGHGGGRGADPAFVRTIGLAAFALDFPRDVHGVDIGASPTPYEQAETLAASAYAAGRTWFLTNGASQANHAIMLALAAEGEQIVVQRNCHGSVIDGLVLSGGAPTYVMPHYDPGTGIAGVVTPKALREALRAAPGARTAVIVSPTYFGAVADIAGCAAVAHEADVTLVVDGAWGPHFGFHPVLPGNALEAGADVLVTSTHKHAGSLTQSAMLHVARDRPELEHRLERSVRMLRSTSPSSLLLASLDVTRRQLAYRGQELLGNTMAIARRLREGFERVAGCRVIGKPTDDPGARAWDPLRIGVDLRRSGARADDVARRLREVHDVHPELVLAGCVVFVVPLGMPADEADAVVSAFSEVIATADTDQTGTVGTVTVPRPGLPRVSPRAAFVGRTQSLALGRAVGRTSAEAVSAYPPGIPFLLPGEEITADAVQALLEAVDAGARIHGASDPSLRRLVVTSR